MFVKVLIIIKSKIMNKLFIATALVLSFVLFSAFTTEDNSSKYKHIIGTWEYVSEDAPYEYSEGNIIFSIVEGKLKGIVDIEGYKMDLENVEGSKSAVTFSLYVEGEDVAIKMNISGKSSKGTATFSQGALPFTAKKVK